MEPWPRLFHNLRASRETELAENSPVHVVAAWLGNTPRIAMRHYLQVRESDFLKAVQKAVQRAPNSGQAVQNPVQPACATSRQEATQPQAMPGVGRELATAAKEHEWRGQDSNL